MHRSIDTDPGLLRDGANALRIDLEQFVQLDRLHMERSYGETGRPAKRRAARSD